MKITHGWWSRCDEGEKRRGRTRGRRGKEGM
jgi:hypothetical protein